jgi:hypothetical protein
MVTVVKTPQGHKIIDQAIASTIIDSSGDALITEPYHSLTTGAYIYIDSDIEEYNGFWYVTVIDYESFKISEHSASDFVEFYQEADIDYYQTQSHDWSSIFLPIVYKCTNNRWPTNSVDTARTISSQSDDNGFTNLNLSGDIKSSGGGINALEFVKISSALDDDLNGVWQIVEVISSSDITISLPYVSTNDFTGASIQYYYNNYQVKVKIYGGLPALHPWADKKPFEEVAELSLTPNEDNEVTFSVAEYIRMKVDIKNNPLIYSYPLNLDAFTGFYIATAESYDDSDNYTLTTTESAFANDTFEGYAIAGKLPFKNTYSGDYAEYVMTSGSPAQWLTLFERPIAVEGKYFDISFIKNIRGLFWIIIDKYVTTYLTQTDVIEYSDQGIGVYRIPITADTNYDSFCIRAYTPGVPASGGVPEAELDALSLWENVTFGWTLGANPTISVNGNGGVSNYIEGNIFTTAGYDYEFTAAIDIGVTGSSDPISEIVWGFMDASYNIINTVTFNYTTAGVKTETFTLNSPVNAAHLALRITNNTPFDTKNYTINSAVYNAPASPPDDSIAAQNLTEEICIDIMATCDVDNAVAQDLDIRLLEDGDYRLLE